MKKIILMSVLCLSLFAVNGVETARAQKKQRLNSTPKAFQIFYAKFRKAVVKDDKNLVASLTRFPFEYGFDAGSEGTFSKTQFLEEFDNIFDAESKIFAQKNPVFYVEAGTFNLTDTYAASLYSFEKKGASYKFTSFAAVP